jgi:hypothetical protein
MGADELLIQQNSVPEGEAASPVQERAKHVTSLIITMSNTSGVGAELVAAAPAVGRVVAPAAAAFKLLLWGRALL